MSDDDRMRWMDAGCPGANMLLPVPLLPLWSGSLPPKDGRVIEATFRWQRDGGATDYDRACDVWGDTSLVPVGDGSAIVLRNEGSQPVGWAPMPDGGVMIAQLYTLEEGGLPERMPHVRKNLAWRHVGEIVTDGAPLRLFHSTEPGDEEPVFDVLDVELAAGRYVVESATLKNPRMELWLARLRAK